MNVRKAAVLLAVALAPAAILAAQAKTGSDLVAEAKKGIAEVTAQQAKAMIDKGGYLVVDVREPEEYAAERIPGAVSIPRGLLEFTIESKAKDRAAPIIVYCKKDGRGALATQSLQAMGYTKVVNVTGGIVAWMAASLPVEKGTK